MRISHFTDFLTHETVFSVCCRYQDRIQFPSYSIVSQHFFGSYKKGGVSDLPSNLEHLIQALSPHHMYTADIIIDQHTLFPLYAPFLPYERAHALRQGMKADGNAIHWIAGIVTSKVVRPQWLRYCPSCVDSDRITYGECYWHRLHQIPGVLVCPVHEVMLEDSNITLRPGNGVAQFRSAEQSVDNSASRIIPADRYYTLIQLARNAQWMLEHTISVEREHIQQRVLGLLADRGFVTATGKVQYTRLKKAVENYYPTGLLEDLGCDIARSKENWLANWTTMQHPLHYLLFIQFLCETPEEFFAKPHHSSAPFGNGPWPCLNPLCSHHKERVIKSYSLRQGNNNQPVATFSCSCGFTYSRTGPDESDAALFRGKTIRFGEVWDQCLSAYWLDPTISTLQVARLIHSDVATIRRQGARLGLPFSPDIPRRGTRPRIYQDFVNEQRDIYRTMWEDALKAHPNMGIRKVVKTSQKAYSWLHRHDQLWLKEHWPTADTTNRSERLIRSKIQVRHDTYSLIDVDLARVVKETSKEIQAISDFPVQITRQLLAAQIGHPALLKKPGAAFDSLPLTSHALSEAVETQAAFIWRKLRWTVQSCLIEQTHPSYTEFLSRAHIGLSTSHRPIIKQLIQIAYSSLNADTPLRDQVPEVHVEVEKKAVHIDENVETSAKSSLTAALRKRQSEIVAHPKQQIYDTASVLLMTVAATVNGAETCHAIAQWGVDGQ